MSQERAIFKRGSKTYYLSSRFFPSAVRSDVAKLYSFVRTADNYVDEQPLQLDKLHALRRHFREYGQQPDHAVHDANDINARLAKNMSEVARKYAFDPAWVETFLDTMETDAAPPRYATLADTLRYIHGSAEVIGLMMARLLGLPKQLDPAAQLQGRAMQYINFIRDIAQDTALGRCYFPAEDLERFGLADLTESTARHNAATFTDFMHFQITRYEQWQAEAAKSYAAIPKRYRIPIQTAADMYNWTARQIARDPLTVFTRKVAPHPFRVVRRALLHSARQHPSQSR